MKQISLFLFLTLIVFACGGGDTSSSSSGSSNAAASNEVSEIDVEKLWKVRCIACHGLYGDMGTNGAANLQEVTSTFDYRVNIITNGSESGIMTPFGDILSEEEIEALARYTMSFNENL